MLHKKEEDKSRLPDLPYQEMDSPPNLSEQEDELDIEKHSLPTFPDTPTHNKFSEIAIKDAVSPEEHELPPLPDFPEHQDEQDDKFKTIEMKEWAPHPKLKEIKAEGISSSSPKSKDLFIKIDKFHSAKKALYSVRENLEEIESLLSKIRETKQREEQELNSWENEVTTAKSHIQKVTEDIFEKVD
tara:strand:- start:6436 stop:6993 length:558 start_codon:yes stop_codon:yes gene_type:complete